MKQYHEMLEHILKHGEEREDRTGTGTISVFGYQNRYDLSEGFPLVTTKKVPFRIIAEELFWFLSGSTNLYDLLQKDVHIWNADAFRQYRSRGGELSFDEFVERSKEVGYDLGYIYGKQWTNWETEHGFNPHIDQIREVILSILSNPYGRRHIVSAWNVGELDKMVLPPCHMMFQFYVSKSGKLSCHLYQRSGDAFLGVPFNIASYALLTHMIADITGYQVGEFVHSFGDVHIYKNHIEQVKTQLSREILPLPTLSIRRDFDRTAITDFTIDDFKVVGYKPHPAIKGDVSVG